MVPNRVVSNLYNIFVCLGYKISLQNCLLLLTKPPSEWTQAKVNRENFSKAIYLNTVLINLEREAYWGKKNFPSTNPLKWTDIKGLAVQGLYI